MVALGIGFYRYSSNLFEQNAYTNLSALANRMSQQVDNLIRPMDFVTMYLLSNGEFMSAMASLSALDRADPDNLLYLNEGWQTINGALLSYSLTKNFYSVNVFNRRGDFLSSNFQQHRDVRNVAAAIGHLPWAAEADRAAGRAVILPPYPDPWTAAPGAAVYGLARSVQGPTGGMGYLEVQNSAEDLSKLFTVPDLRAVAGLGVEVDERGSHRIAVQPRPGGGITHAQAELMTPYGRAAVSWKLAGGTISVEMTVPHNATARVVLPGATRAVLGRQAGSQMPRSTVAARVPRSTVAAFRDRAGGAEALLGSGDWRFEYPRTST